MRATLAPLLGLALALAPGNVRADPPRTVMRLDYARGQGAETCPAEPTALRAEVARWMGYDPFDPGEAATPERLAVTVSRQGRGFAARIERYDAGGALTWSEVFPGTGGTCAALVSPLATALRALLLGPPIAPPPRPPAPAAPAPAPPPAVAAPLAPKVEAPPTPPEPPSVPNPTRRTIGRVAIVSYAVGAAFLGLGIGWSVYAQDQRDIANARSDQVHRSGGTMGCTSGATPGSVCQRALEAWQSSDNARRFRNGWFAAAGASVALGAIATVWALTLPETVKAPQAQVRLTPGGVVLTGTF